jgi:hypothetical protein
VLGPRVVDAGQAMRAAAAPSEIAFSSAWLHLATSPGRGPMRENVE